MYVYEKDLYINSHDKLDNNRPKQYQCPLTRQGIICWYTHAMEYYVGRKIYDLLRHKTTWIFLKSIIQTESFFFFFFCTTEYSILLILYKILYQTNLICGGKELQNSGHQWDIKGTKM